MSRFTLRLEAELRENLDSFVYMTANVATDCEHIFKCYAFWPTGPRCLNPESAMSTDSDAT